MNGALGANQLGGVRFEKRQSVEGSVSSMETLTTPLSLDQSRDNGEDLFPQTKTTAGRSRNVSGGSNLNPVPESPVEDTEHNYYNTSDTSSIESYNKVGYSKDPLAPESPSSVTNSSPLPAMLCSVEGTSYHTFSSPETSPVRSTPKEWPLSGSGGAEKGTTAASVPEKTNLPTGQQSPTESPGDYDVPSMISPYSKVSCVDFPVSDYDSSAGSFASTDTVIDTFKNKKPAPMPPADDYVSQGFMASMASNSSLNSSNASDIDPYTVVGEREPSTDSNTDTYVDEEVESDESQPLCLNLELESTIVPVPTTTGGYVQAPPPMLTKSKRRSDSDDMALVRSPPPPVSNAPLTNGYVLAPPPPPNSVAPTGSHVNEPPPVDSGSYVPHVGVNSMNSGSSFHDPGYVADLSSFSNNNKANMPCKNGQSFNGHGDRGGPMKNATDSSISYLPHSMTMGVKLPPTGKSIVDSTLPDGSSNSSKNSSAFPNVNHKKPHQALPPEPQNSGYISPECLDALGTSRSNGVSQHDAKTSCTSPQQQQQQSNDSYVTIDSLTSGSQPITNGVDDSLSEGSSDQDGDYTSNIGMIAPPQNNGYVAHVTC